MRFYYYFIMNNAQKKAFSSSKRPKEGAKRRMRPGSLRDTPSVRLLPGCPRKTFTCRKSLHEKATFLPASTDCRQFSIQNVPTEEKARPFPESSPPPPPHPPDADRRAQQQSTRGKDHASGQKRSSQYNKVKGGGIHRLPLPYYITGKLSVVLRTQFAYRLGRTPHLAVVQSLQFSLQLLTVIRL